VVGVVDEFNHLRQRGSLEKYKSQPEELRAAMLMCNPYYDDNLFRQRFLGVREWVKPVLGVRFIGYLFGHHSGCKPCSL
jgi:hypothetical protein